jgi:DNA polymerase I
MDDTRDVKPKRKGLCETVCSAAVCTCPKSTAPTARAAGAERAAINAPMQGTAADLIKMSMVAVQHAIDQQQRQTKVIMQVHDELVFEVPESEVAWVKTEVPRLMADVAQLKVPLLAEVGVGLNWDEAH